MEQQPSISENPRIVTTVGALTLLGWPTDVFSIDFVAETPGRSPQTKTHTVLLFTPGNPGLMEWYLPFFRQILEKLGDGYAVRGVANASHSIDPSKVHVAVSASSPSKHCAIPWTVEGQAQHKIAFVDHILQQLEQDRSPADGKLQLILVSHSIGCHFCQRMCISRPDILQRVRCTIHLMPFVRMDAPKDKQWLLDFVAARPNATIQFHETLMHGLASLPLSAVDALLINTMNDPDGRRVAANLLQLPDFARNFFTLGCEEIRDVPQDFDVCALRLFGRQCPVYFLFAGKDHWSPQFHIHDLNVLQNKGLIPGNRIHVTYNPSLQHDFVSNIDMIPIVVQFSVDCILGHQKGKPPLPSKL